MHFEPSARFHSQRFRPAAAVGATLAAGMLLVSCDADTSDVDTSWFDDLFSSDSDDDDDDDNDGTAAPGEDEDTDEADDTDEAEDDEDSADTEDDSADADDGADDDADDDDESWWEGLFGSDDDEDDADDADGDADGDADADAEEPEDTDDAADDDDESWWEGLFGSDDEDDAEDDTDDEDEDAQDEEESLALPASCTEVDAEQVAAGLTPQGTVLEENSGEVEGATDAEQLSCTWAGAGDETGAETFALVFTQGTDPGARLDVAQPSDEDEMNWEVDIDVDLDNYRTSAAEALGGELDYVRTVEGSTQSLHLSLPDDFYVSAISVAGEATQEDLEQAVLDAAERMEE